MTKANFAKSQDQLSGQSHSDGSEPIDPTALLGTWINTNKATQGITMAVITRRDDDLHLRVFGAADPEPHDWGEVAVKALFSDGIVSGRVISFVAEYTFDFMETELQTNLSKGLLIVTSLNAFKDGSGRSDYFSREYFYKDPRSCE